MNRLVFRSLAVVLALTPLSAFAHSPHVCAPTDADSPAYEHGNTLNNNVHVSQQDIINHLYEDPGTETPYGPIFTIGGKIAEVRWNECDGQGRPATTGEAVADAVAAGVSTKRNPAGQLNNQRISGPEGTSCFGCHAQPRTGGSGDFVANTFNGAEDMDPVTDSINPAQVNERRTKGMFGSGYVEILGIEMSQDLQSQAAKIEATQTASTPAKWYSLTTKGVEFDVEFAGGKIIDTHGVDSDLIVKPFGSGGTVSSMRQFTVQAFNRHHGMQAEESYDDYLGDKDYDQDGVKTELTIGDITMIALWQAMLQMPVQVLPVHDDATRAAVAQGQVLFDQVGCTGCHIANMTVDNRMFCEPNIYNPPEIFHDQSQKYCVPLNLRAHSQAKADPHHLDETHVTVQTLSDLKRHDLCDPTTTANAIRALCNEQQNQGRPNVDGVPGYEFFITPRLWATHSSAPYGHNGHYPSVYSIILVHAGEATPVRKSFLALSISDQSLIIQYLKTLRVKDQRLRVNNES